MILEAADILVRAVPWLQRRRIIGKGIDIELWFMLLIRSSLAHYDYYLDPQRKPGAPIIHIRHVDDWLERQCCQEGGWGYILRHTGGVDFGCGGRGGIEICGVGDLID